MADHAEHKEQDRQQPPRNHGKKVRTRGEETTWHKPEYKVVEASMEMTAYFLATR
jgi:coenzyme PQQ precursor peptide PqqA